MNRLDEIKREMIVEIMWLRIRLKFKLSNSKLYFCKTLIRGKVCPSLKVQIR